ncbi:hypothetical protein YC2023_024794 [Brassica napus]
MHFPSLLVSLLIISQAKRVSIFFTFFLCWLLLTSLTRMTQFQELELEKQPSSSKWRLQSLARKRQDVRQ